MSQVRVTDAEILQAIWRAQVKRTARGVIDNYVGGRKSLGSERSQWFAQMLYMISREGLGLPLSKGHLGKRLKQVIGNYAGLRWHGIPGNGYQFVNARADEVFHAARAWWAERGVPSGLDENKRCRTAEVEDFEGKVAQLEQDLLIRFGGMRP